MGASSMAVEVSMSYPQLPRNGMVLKGPVQLASGEIECYSCHKTTAVVSIVASQVLEIVNGQLDWEYDEPSFVRDIGEDEMPAGLAAALARLAPRYRPRYSRTMGETTWANGCVGTATPCRERSTCTWNRMAHSLAAPMSSRAS